MVHIHNFTNFFFHFSRHTIIEKRKEYLEKLNIHRENEEKRKAADALAEQQKLEEERLKQERDARELERKYFFIFK